MFNVLVISVPGNCLRREKSPQLKYIWTVGPHFYLQLARPTTDDDLSCVHNDSDFTLSFEIDRFSSLQQNAFGYFTSLAYLIFGAKFKRNWANNYETNSEKVFKWNILSTMQNFINNNPKSSNASVLANKKRWCLTQCLIPSKLTVTSCLKHFSTIVTCINT